MSPTRTAVLAAIAAPLAAMGWAFGLLVEGRGKALPQVPPPAAAVLLVFALVLLHLAVTTRGRLRDRRERRPGARDLDPLAVARYAVLARAASPVGAGLVGGYAGYALFCAGDWAEPGRGGLTLWAGLTALAAAGLVAAALFLEQVCRIPGDPPAGSGVRA